MNINDLGEEALVYITQLERENKILVDDLLETKKNFDISSKYLNEIVLLLESSLHSIKVLCTDGEEESKSALDHIGDIALVYSCMMENEPEHVGDYKSYIRNKYDKEQKSIIQ